MKNLERLITIAKDLKTSRQTGTHFIVAFAIKQGRILRIGINDYQKTDTINKNYVKADGSIAPFRHAESDLIKKLKEADKDKIILYVVRINNSGKASMSKPCSNCSYLLGLNGFKAVYFTNDAGQFEKLGK